MRLPGRKAESWIFLIESNIYKGEDNMNYSKMLNTTLVTGMGLQPQYSLVVVDSVVLVVLIASYGISNADNLSIRKLKNNLYPMQKIRMLTECAY